MNARHLTLLYFVTLWQTSVLVPRSPTPRVSRIIRLLLWITWSVKWFAFKPWITLAKFPVTVWGKKKKRSRYFSIFKGNILFKFSFLFFSFPLFFLSVLGYWLECWPFLPLLTWIASAKPRFEFFLFLFPEMSLLFIFYLCFYHYPFLFCIFSAFSLSPWKCALQVL